MPEEVVLTPNYANTVRYFAQGLDEHAFEKNAHTPILSFMEQIRYLCHTQPGELNRIIEEWRKKSNG